MGLSLQELADIFDVSYTKLRMTIKEYGLRKEFSDVSDDELKEIITAFRKTHPASGLRHLTGMLRSHGVRIQRNRLRLAAARLDPIGAALRSQQGIIRRKYMVARPNALWHMDGHHKLIPWGIVIHGIIDGFCRTVRHITSISTLR